VELREYLSVLQRRWLIVVAVTGLALVVATLLAFRGPRAYEAATRVVVSVGVDSRAETPPYVYYRDYYAWLASEYLADDLSEIIKSDAFAADIAVVLGEGVDRSAIKEVIRTRKTHRILEITVLAPTAVQAQRIAAAVGRTVQEQSPKYLAQLASQNGQVRVLDEPVVKAATTTGSQLADIGVRALLGLLAGVFLAYMVDYLDSTVRTSKEIERMLALPVLGEIPGTAR
jgi:capsular polysaccharide biosynthesis protein